MPGVLLWGYDSTNKVWIPLQVDTNGYVKVDLSNVKLNDLADVSVASPTNGHILYYHSATGLWKAKAHTALTTGIHGVGVHGFADATRSALTYYADQATGDDGNPGTSANPKKTILGALNALPKVIAHAPTICVRPGAYPENNVALEFARFNTLAAITIKTVNANDEDMYDNGLATGWGNDYLDDSGKSWSADQFKDAYIWIFHGTGEGQIRQISGNTDTRISVTANWTTNPDGTSYYAIGGGVTMTGTDLFHVWITGKLVEVYGFRHTGATHTDIRVDTSGVISVGNNYFATSVRGIGSYWLGIIKGPDPGCNYSAATTAGFDISALSYGVIRGNVITGAAKGIRLYYESMVAGSATAYRQNHIMKCTVGISVESGSGMPEASSQSFGAGGDANGDDILPDPSENLPRWWT